ncbi:N-myc-interactor [Morone saxatilis]|uniref:N-myc-interactor n=1 Tax=Morone saxatilis TaxID=34816 RepID=UPI0015E21B48|nr:N-myc-interactor [Morone saxatilis]
MRINLRSLFYFRSNHLFSLLWYQSLFLIVSVLFVQVEISASTAQWHLVWYFDNPPPSSGTGTTLSCKKLSTGPAVVFLNFSCYVFQAKVEKADDVKARLILEKLDQDEAKSQAQQEMFACVKKQEESQKEYTKSMNALQEEILKLGKRKQDLLDQLKRYQDELEAKRAESTKLKQKFKIYVQIPDTEVKFIAENKGETGDDCQPIRGLFAIHQRPTVLLQGGQALITFEEEKVASQILKIAKCSVPCDNISVDVKPKRIKLDPAVKFEVHLDVSRKALKVSSIPSSMPEERMKDRLEISFCRPSRGGGEVEMVEYDQNTGTGQITFLHPGGTILGYIYQDNGVV